MPGHAQQASVDEMKHCVLNAALRQSGALSKLGMAEARRAVLGRRGQSQIDKERRCAVIVADEISHQRVQDVRVDYVSPVAHCYVIK